MLYKNHVSTSNTVSALFRLPRQNTTWQTCAWTEHGDRFPRYSSVFSGAVSTLKVKCHTQTYGRLHRDRSAEHIPWTRRSMLWQSAAAFQPQCWRTFCRTNSHLSFIPSFHWFCFYAQRVLPLQIVATRHTGCTHRHRWTWPSMFMSLVTCTLCTYGDTIASFPTMCVIPSLQERSSRREKDFFKNEMRWCCECCTTSDLRQFKSRNCPQCFGTGRNDQGGTRHGGSAAWISRTSVFV